MFSKVPTEPNAISNIIETMIIFDRTNTTGRLRKPSAFLG